MSSGVFINPEANGSQNPQRFYLDGKFPTWVHPGIAATWQPRGSTFPGPSDARKTFTDPSREIPGNIGRGREGRGFAPSLVGNPFGTEDPGIHQSNEPWGGAHGEPMSISGPEGKVHEPNPDARTERQTSGNLLTNFDASKLGGIVEDVWATSPVAAFFWGLASIWLINQIFLKEDALRSGTRSVARGTATAGRAPTRVAGGAAGGTLAAFNQSISGAVDAVEGVVS